MSRRLLLLVVKIVLLSGAISSCAQEDQPDSGAASPAAAGHDDGSISEQLDETWASIASRDPGLDRPARPEIERIIRLSEWPTTITDCLNEKGFPVTTLSDGGISFESVPPEQAGALELEMYLCEARFPVDPRDTAALSPEEVLEHYEYNVNFLASCLEDQGYDISAPPSSETFQAQWQAGQNVWSPFNDVPNVDQEEWERLNKECPQVPTA